MNAKKCRKLKYFDPKYHLLQTIFEREIENCGSEERGCFASGTLDENCHLSDQIRCFSNYGISKRVKFNYDNDKKKI